MFSWEVCFRSRVSEGEQSLGCGYLRVCVWIEWRSGRVCVFFGFCLGGAAEGSLGVGCRFVQGSF